jgi:hypothetical protein
VVPYIKEKTYKLPVFLKKYPGKYFEIRNMR